MEGEECYIATTLRKNALHLFLVGAPGFEPGTGRV
jgi:hypothetical protein